MDEERMQMLPVKESQFPFAPLENNGTNCNVEDDRIGQSVTDMSVYCKRYANSGLTLVLHPNCMKLLLGY